MQQSATHTNFCLRSIADAAAMASDSPPMLGHAAPVDARRIEAAAASSSPAAIAASASSVLACSACACSHHPRSVAAPRATRESRVEMCEYPLLLASLQPQHIAASTGAICGLLFFPSQSSRYFSYTHTLDELSLMLDPQTAAAAFPGGRDSVLQGNEQSWRVLEIVEGAEILDTPGIVSSLCGPLLEHRVVEEMLYLSTFSSDLLLVREKAVQSARVILSENLDFLVDSRRRAHEELAKAELREQEEAQRRARMEEEDRLRAIAGGDEAIEEPAAAASHHEGISALALHDQSSSDSPLLLPARSASGSVGSYAGQTDIFEFELRSQATGSPTQSIVGAPLAREANVTATKLAQDVFTHASSASRLPQQHQQQPPSHAAAAVSVPAAMPPASSSSASVAAPLPHLAQESEGDADGSQGIDMHLSTLPFRLVLLTFHVDHLPACTHAILHALMHPSSSSSASGAAAAPSSSPSPASVPTSLRPNFFSFTQAGTEVSLILEACFVPLFPRGVVTQHRSVWRAIQVSLGSEIGGEEGAGAGGLVAPLSATLAREGFSIFYLSSATLDYVLVAEHALERAIQTLRVNMKVLVDS